MLPEQRILVSLEETTITSAWENRSVKTISITHKKITKKRLKKQKKLDVGVPESLTDTERCALFESLLVL